MNKFKKIGFLILILSITTVFARAEAPADATIKISGGAAALGIGVSWGKGTLTYKGRDYPISVSGLSLGKVGFTSNSAGGEVYHMKDLKDFDGNYTGVGAGVTLAGGRHAITVKNQHGVRVRLISTSKGIDVTIAAGGVDMKLKK